VLGYRLLLRPSLRAADHVIVDSAHTRSDLLARRLVAAEKLSVIHLAATADFRPGVRTEDFLRRYDVPFRFIFTVGVLEPRKNHARLVQALSRLHQQGERIGLVIVGRDGWRWQDPLADASLAHLRPWVRIFRDVPDADLAELYNRAEVFAYPSLYEGFGLPVVEAMACGTPVVTSPVSSLPEVAGKAALFADPTDADDLAAKLSAVLRDPALRSRLVAEGKQQAGRFSWQRTALATLRVYETVCGRPPRSTC
jgi:glycosyltransferase involved in cell wall biosynthesis